MSYFDTAFDVLMRKEGGGEFHIVPGDPGGATRWGMSLRFMKGLPLEVVDLDRDGHVTASDVALLSEDSAKAFYRKHFWLHYQLQTIERESVAVKLFCIFVNMRGRVAGRVAQRALGSCGVNGIKEDGYLGPISLREINEITCDTSLAAMYLAALRAQQEGVYRLIVAHNPANQKFLDGWINRARDK